MATKVKKIPARCQVLTKRLRARYWLISNRLF
jgi:hypothetical protein